MKRIVMRELTWKEMQTLPDKYLLKYYKFHAERNANNENNGNGVPLSNLYSELSRRGYYCHIEIKQVMIIEDKRNVKFTVKNGCIIYSS